MEITLNIFHYCIYRMHYKLHLIANKVNPFRLLYKIPFVRDNAEKNGINISNGVDKAFSNKYYGISMTIAGGLLFGLIFIFFFTINNIVLSIANKYFDLPAWYLFGLAILGYITSYFFVFRNDKYLNYFNRFGKWEDSKRSMYMWLSFFTIIAIISLFCLSIVLYVPSNL